MAAAQDTGPDSVVGREVSRTMLPSSLLKELESPTGGAPAPGRSRRTTRDWVVDVACFLLAVIVGLLFLLLTVEESVEPMSEGFIAIDAVVGSVIAVTLWWRRRWPVAVAVITTLAATVLATPAIASVIALFTVVIYCRLAVALQIAVLQTVCGFVFYTIHEQVENPLWLQAFSSVLLQSAVIAWGLFVKARRQLLLSLRDRAERAEAEQRLRADQARASERTRIAREMHDVLAHRVSLIALQAGALEVRPDLPTETVRETAGLIRGTARQALEELRGVIGVLRDERGADMVQNAPQPTLGDVRTLVAESSRAGVHVDLDMHVAEIDAAPAALGRDAYRIVQEALTNVNKHARGTATRVSLRGAPGTGLQVRVANRLPLGPGVESYLPGAGAGLLGLRERVTLAGGTLEHGPTPGGEFVVAADLRWGAESGTAAP